MLFRSKLSSFAFRKHHRLELEVLKNADRVISVGNMMKKEFDNKRGSETNVITNGFDSDDFEVGDVKLSDEFSIVHVGSFLERRNPFMFWKAIKELIEENEQFKKHLKIRLTGRIEPTILKSIMENKLDSFVEVNTYLSHDKVIIELKRSQLLLLPIDDFEGAKWVLTGKLFEYLAAKRPILCIGPTDGDAAQVIMETESGKTFGFNDISGIKNQLMIYFNLYLKHQLEVNSSSIDKYSRKQLTGNLVSILNEITE